MHLANAISLALFLAFAFNFTLVELPKTQVSQLNTASVSYCELTDCPRIQGLELTNGETAIDLLATKPYGELLTLNFTNHEQLEGKRELWLKVEHADGRILEMVSVTIELGLKTRTAAEFILVSEKDQILAGKILLGY